MAWLRLVPLALFLLQNFVIIPFEERSMRHVGEEYEAYCARVRRGSEHRPGYLRVHGPAPRRPTGRTPNLLKAERRRGRCELLRGVLLNRLPFVMVPICSTPPPTGKM